MIDEINLDAPNKQLFCINNLDLQDFSSEKVFPDVTHVCDSEKQLEE